jgi:nitroimidazol reductase NimA-like FMN-containing flavoprotein (pyridoxamine 5'-phosphate oxidase superfamily)
MLGELNQEQIDHVLNTEVVGRIGCYADNRIYVVPVTFGYDGTFVYAHSKEGMKIEMMRSNPEVCFQVDVMENMANWRSVIAWGTYEEISDDAERQAAMNILMTKLMPLVTSETVRPHRQTMSPQIVEKEKRAIVYRIRLTSKTGRFEKN